MSTDWLQAPVLARDDQASSSAFGRTAAVIFRQPFRARCWNELGYCIATSVLAGAAVSVLALVGFSGLLLTLVLVGIPILAAGLRLARKFGQWQRDLANKTINEQLAHPEPLQAVSGWSGWLRATFFDRAAWRAIGYFLLKVPLTFAMALAVGTWLLAVVGIASPLLGSAGSERLLAHVLMFAPGAALFFIAPWAVRFFVEVDRRLMRALLGPDPVRRVRDLETSRAKAIDTATETLQRIERDLHDGTQAQLVALAMRLGQAKDKLADDDADIDAIRRLVDQAHSGAKEAISDLREVARGIHPPVLDAGLDQALATLAARSPVPAELTVSIQRRPSLAIEAIAYFCVAELLANVAQHAQATHSSVSCIQKESSLRLVVIDDGKGGAAVRPAGSSSSGIAGLIDRVNGVEGQIQIDSPIGGPTVITVDLPTAA